MNEIQKRSRTPGKPKDPEGNRAAILATAVAEFAERGFHGARVNIIAETSGRDKQLLYYYFNSKEGLYIAALEYAYAQARLSQANLVVNPEDPLGSLTELVLAAFDFVTQNPDIIRLIAYENVEKAIYLKKSSVVQSINHPIIEKLEQIIEIGVAKGSFRPDLDALELHHVTSALTNHYITNAYTFGYIFDIDFFSADSREAYRSTIEKVVSGFVLLPQPTASTVGRRATRANGRSATGKPRAVPGSRQGAKP